jgi:hypothetical protein
MQELLEEVLEVLKKRLFARAPGHGAVIDEEESAIIHDMGTVRKVLEKLRK